jgi:hypothetical protein
MAAADQLRPHGWKLGRADNPELRLAASAARFATIAAVPMLSYAWLAAGAPGLAGAAIAVILVTVLLWGSAVLLTVLVRRSGTALMVGVYAGFIARLAATAVVLAALQPLEGIDMLSLVITTIVLMITVLIYESWHVCHTPDFFWVDPRPAQARGQKERERTFA